MNKEQKRQYQEKYVREKQSGVHFYPDIIYKDLVVSFALFMLLVGLAVFVGVPNEPPADPNDTSYVPRPEWYFLFLFQMLKYFPGQIEWLGTAILPALAVAVLFLLPFIDKNPRRYWKHRKTGVAVMSVIVIGMVALTTLAVATTPPQEETGPLASSISEKVIAGQDLYSIYCTECHGPDGEGGEVKGVEGLEGVVLDPISSTDVMYTFTDDTFFNIIDYGQPDQGMPPNGLGYGGELKQAEMGYIVTFMRYTWDDRAEIPQDAIAASAIPELGPDEVPSYEQHIQPVVKRYCISCHRPGKENNNYFMTTYAEIMETGDNAPNITPGNLDNNTIHMVYREEIEAGGPMPPTKALPEDYISLFERWILGGAPETQEQAQQATTDAVGTEETLPAEPDSTAVP